MRPQRADIGAPELPGRLRWLNADGPRKMAELHAAGPVLVHFFDFAQLNSVRALPYVNRWAERYTPHGLTVLGVHSPRFSFSGRPELLAAALERLGIVHPVIDDSGYSVWHDYGCKGWPSLFLWARGGALRWFHFGEGEYQASEEAIHDELREIDALVALPAPLGPIRPSDAPGALVAPPSAEVFPGGSPTKPWSGGPIELDYEAGGVHTAVDGSGKISVAIDAGEARSIDVSAPGLVDLVEHPAHQRHHLRLEPGAGVELYSVGFSAALP